MGNIEKFFIHKSAGGLSTCIHDGEIRNLWGRGWTLSNCVGEVWALFNLDHNRDIAECIKQIEFKRIQGNARDIYAKAKKQGSGYKCSYEPRSNSIACYGAGTSTGHVVYLLHVWSNGNAIGIESNYSGTLGNGRALRVKSGKPKTWYKEYQGCIYDFS